MSVIVNLTLLDGVTSPGTGPWLATDQLDGASRSLQATVTGTGAVSALIKFYGRNNNATTGVLLGTATLSGTGEATEGAPINVTWLQIRAELISVTGAGAKVTATCTGFGSLAATSQQANVT